MERITVPLLLEAFAKQVRAGNIGFIKNAARASERDRIATVLTDLLAIFENAGPGEETLNWHECHQYCTELWRLLTRMALRDIDDESKGNAQLSRFLEEATKFEEVLYGLSDHYRDHTLHVMWVYLLGDYLLRGQLQRTYDYLDWYLWNDVDAEPDWAEYAEQAQRVETRLRELVDEKRDAIWCLMALCHDLGYALSKLEDINARVENVLRFFDLHGFDQIGYSLKVEHQYLTKQLVELMADDVRIQPNADLDDVVVKLFRDDGSYWRLCDSLERREHGTLSAFILYKLLGLFGDATLRGPAEQWGLDDEETVDTLIRGSILYGIAQHQFKYVWASELGSLADVLLLCDEVEDFSRWGRPVMTRKYLPTVATVSLGFDYTGEGRDTQVHISIEYDVHPEQNLHMFFSRKIERLAQAYHLQPADNGGRARIGRPRMASRFPKISGIDLVAKGGDETLALHFDREGLKADLPSYDGQPEGEFGIELIDDELYVVGEKEEIDLRTWLGVR